MRTRSLSALTVVLLAMVLLTSGVVTASAAPADRGTVINNVILNGEHLQGMSEAEARAAILSVTRVPNYPTLQVDAGGTKYPLEPETYVVVDVDRMLAEAYAPTSLSTVRLQPRFRLRTAALGAWVTELAKKADRQPVNAKWAVKNESLIVVAAVNGRNLNKVPARTAITRALLREVASRSVQPLVRTTFTSVPAKITGANIGKAIIVDESKRTMRLYSGAKVEKGYRCAVGMRKYPTPKGTFKIIAKAKNPAWRNPGSDWARSMPAYIAPGPANPLGTRALYLNVSGIRIHGTNKISSIGTAASHGCIRLANRDVEDLYPRVPVGIPVFIIK